MSVPLPDSTEAERRRQMIEMARAEAERVEQAAEIRDESLIHVACPYCSETLEICGEASWNQLTCSKCGTSFSLVDHDEPQVPPGNGKLGPFEILELLGVGGFGTVWKARDSRLDRFVAIKVPRRARLTTSESELFLREARAAAQLHHPHIIGLLEIGRQGEIVYLVTDFVDGIPLSDWLNSHRFTVHAAAEFCATMARALAHAHQVGVIHRDLKPSNILVTETVPDSYQESDSVVVVGNSARRRGLQSLVPHLTDFGLAKRDFGEVSVTLDGQVMGTPAYMSPEQAGGMSHAADARTDVYALGVILFELVTGELPFRGDARIMLRQVLEEPPPCPQKLNSAVPNDLTTICLKCLEKEPNRRYSNANDFADDIERFLSGKPIVARPIGSMERLWRWSRRNRGAAIAIILSGLIAIAAPLLVMQQSRLAVREANARKAAEQSDEKARQLAYAFGMNSVQRAIEEGNSARADAILRTYIGPKASNDLRSFEWYYWWNQIHGRNRATLKLPSRPLGISLGHDGSVLASAGMHGNALLWDVEAERIRAQLHCFPQVLNALALSPDNRYLAVCGIDDEGFGKVQIWDVSKRKKISESKSYDKAFSACACSPLGTEFAAACYDRTIRRWRIPDCHELPPFEKHPNAALSVAYSSNGTRLVSGSGQGADAPLKPLGSIIVWDIARHAEIVRRTDLDCDINGTTFSQDGKYVFSSGLDGAPLVFDAETLEPAFELEARQGKIHHVAQDGDLSCAAGGHGGIWCWNQATRKVVAEFAGHADVVYEVALLASKKIAVSCGADSVVAFWDVATRPFQEDIHLPNMATFKITGDEESLRPIAWSKSSLIDLSQGSQMIDVSSLGSGYMLLEADVNRKSAMIQRVSGTTVTELAIWDWDARRFLERRSMEGEIIACAAFLSQQDRFAIGTGHARNSFKNPVQVSTWRKHLHGEPVVIEGHKRVISALEFSHGGRWLAVASGDRQVIIWNSDTGKKVREFKEYSAQSLSFVSDLEFSPDDQVLAGCNSGGELHIWNMRTGAHQVRVRRGSMAMQVCFSPDGKTLAVAQATTRQKGERQAFGEVHLWNTATWELTSILRTPFESLCSVSFSQNGRVLAALHASGEVAIWRGGDARSINEFLKHEITLSENPTNIGVE